MIVMGGGGGGGVGGEGRVCVREKWGKRMRN